mmetsp:Transcript_31649/g.62621  ORF Transcript_31649/g.62621 Transcript_31649/m.62621 type:complete len:205 (+) Transcript_31649:1273-1887(+)
MRLSREHQKRSNSDCCCWVRVRRICLFCRPASKQATHRFMHAHTRRPASTRKHACMHAVILSSISFRLFVFLCFYLHRQEASSSLPLLTRRRMMKWRGGRQKGKGGNLMKSEGTGMAFEILQESKKGRERECERKERDTRQPPSYPPSSCTHCTSPSLPHRQVGVSDKNSRLSAGNNDDTKSKIENIFQIASFDRVRSGRSHST